MSKDQFFQAAAEKLAPRLNINAEELAETLKKREEENSTVLNPFLAVPHLITEGTGRFELLIARAQKGIEFSSDASSVHAVFVLAGTADERTTHLRALSAIARVTQNKEFEPAWLEAKNSQILRDLILLSDRRRTQPA